MAARRDLKGWLGWVLLLANLAVAVGTACFVLLVYLAPESMTVAASTEAGVFRIDVRGDGASWLPALCAAGLLIADFLWLVYGTAPGVPTTHVVSETPEGPVRVARDALETGLRAAGEALDEVSRVRVSVESGGPLSKRVLLRAQFQAPDGVSIQAASQRLRVALRKRFAEMVVLADGTRLDVEIEFIGFQGRLARRADETTAEPEAPEAPFTGPQYPIDDA